MSETSMSNPFVNRKSSFVNVIVALNLFLALIMNAEPQPTNAAPAASTKTQLATFGGGCFWCTEAIYQSLDGVKKVSSGYAGGTVVNPTYEQVCSGSTGHAEVI